MPSPPAAFWPWVLAGAFAQIAATATMLSVMGQRSFVVAYAYIKTEPVQVALFGLIFLGDRVTPLSALAILIATAGVIVISLKAGAGEVRSTRSTAIGLFSGALFALSAIGYRGAILSLHLPDFVLAATFTVTVGLVIQAAMLSVYLWLRDPKVLARHQARLEAVIVRRLHGRLRLGILVPRLRHRHRGQRAHAGAGRGAVRARRHALRFQAADEQARSLPASCWW